MIDVSGCEQDYLALGIQKRIQHKEAVPMSIEANKALIRRFNEEVWNKGNLAAVDELYAPDFAWRSAPPGMPATRDGLRQMIAVFRGAFSEPRSTVDETIAEGDKVAWRWTFQGKHTGQLMGIPPTGKRITFSGISIDRIVDGKSVERIEAADFTGFLQQLGAMPAR